MRIRDDITEFQHSLLTSEMPNLAISGGLGVGKTAVAARFAVNQMVRYPGSMGAVGCPTYPQLFQSVFIEIEFLLAKYGIRYKFQPMYKKLTLSNGSTLFFVSFDVPESRLKGPEYDWGIVDEADAVEYQHFRRFADRIGRDIKTRGSGLLRVFGNPVPYSHWMHEEFRLKSLDGHELWEIPTYENRRYLAPGYIEKLESRYEVGTPGHDRWILGKCGVPSEDAIYPEFNLRTDTITRDQVADEGGFLRYRPAAFFGRDGLPFGYLVTGITPKGTVVAVDEVYTKQKSPSFNVRQVKEVHPGGTILADRTHPLYSEYRRGGLRLGKARIERSVGVARLRNMIAAGDFKILEDKGRRIRCRHLRNELESHEEGDAHEPERENCSLIIPLEYVACRERDYLDPELQKRLGLPDVMGLSGPTDHTGGKIIKVV